MAQTISTRPPRTQAAFWNRAPPPPRAGRRSGKVEPSGRASRREPILQPKVARDELPWVTSAMCPINPAWVAAPPVCSTPPAGHPEGSTSSSPRLRGTSYLGGPSRCAPSTQHGLQRRLSAQPHRPGIPKGAHLPAQGCEGRATLGDHRNVPHQPSVGCSAASSVVSQPPGTARTACSTEDRRPFLRDPAPRQGLHAYPGGHPATNGTCRGEDCQNPCGVFCRRDLPPE